MLWKSGCVGYNLHRYGLNFFLFYHRCYYTPSRLYLIYNLHPSSYILQKCNVYDLKNKKQHLTDFAITLPQVSGQAVFLSFFLLMALRSITHFADLFNTQFSYYSLSNVIVVDEEMASCHKYQSEKLPLKMQSTVSLFFLGFCQFWLI